MNLSLWFQMASFYRLLRVKSSILNTMQKGLEILFYLFIYLFFLLSFFLKVAVTAIVIFVILPLTLVGTVLGRNLSGAPNVPCRVNTVPRPIPEKKW